jgi:hypothetical protein
MLLLAASCCYLVTSLLAYGMGELLSGHAFIQPMRMQPPFPDLRYLGRPTSKAVLISMNSTQGARWAVILQAGPIPLTIYRCQSGWAVFCRCREVMCL